MTFAAWVIFVKEITDNFRDRRSWSKVIIVALLGPFMMAGMATFISQEREGDGTDTVDLPMVGAALAPGLVQHLTQAHFNVVPAPDDAEAAVRAGTKDFVLVVTPEFVKAFDEARPAPVRIVLDQSRTKASVMHRLENALRDHGLQVGAYRLWARGVDPRVVMALAVETENTEPPLSRLRPILVMVPMFILVSAFLGGLYVAIDVTAGERERGSLEQLLLNPVSAADVVLGKLGAVLVSTLATTFLTTMGYMVVLNAGLFDLPGVVLSLSTFDLGRIYAMMFPVTLLSSSLLMLLASRTSSFKEASTSAQLLFMMPMIPGLMATFMPRANPPAWAPLVPIYGQEMSISAILQRSPTNSAHVALCAGVTLAIAFGVIATTIRRYDRERVVVGR